MVDRMSLGVNNHESILKICFPDIKELPELTWLFPEGDPEGLT